MKYLIVCLFLISSLTALLQESKYICDSYIKSVPIINGEVVYSEVVPEKASKETLFNRAKAFLTSILPNFTNVVKVDDRDLCKIGVRGIFSKHISGKGLKKHYISYCVNLVIQVKNGRNTTRLCVVNRGDRQFSGPV